MIEDMYCDEESNGLKKLEEETKELVFYYPISPNIAITVNDENCVDKIELSEGDVEKYNRIIIDASYELIIADNKSVLEKYIFRN